MDFQSKKDHIIDMYFNQDKNYSEIAKLTHTSPNQIKLILDEERQKRFHDKVILMIKYGKTIKEMAIELNLGSKQIERIWEQYLSYKDKDTLYQLYTKIKDSPEKFLNLAYTLYEKNMNASDISELIDMREKIYQYVKVRDSLQSQVNDLQNEISSLKQQVLELENKNKTKESQIKEIENYKDNLQEKVSTLKVKLQEIELSVNYIKNGHTYAEFQKKFQQLLKNDQKLSSFLSVMIETIFDNLYPYALINKIDLENSLTTDIISIDNYDDFIDDDHILDPTKDPMARYPTEELLIEKLKERIKNFVIDEYFQHETDV